MIEKLPNLPKPDRCPTGSWNLNGQLFQLSLADWFWSGGSGPAI